MIKQKTVKYFIGAQFLESDTKPGDKFFDKISLCVIKLYEKKHGVDGRYPHVAINNYIFNKKKLGYTVEATITWT